MLCEKKRVETKLIMIMAEYLNIRCTSPYVLDKVNLFLSLFSNLRHPKDALLFDTGALGFRNEMTCSHYKSLPYKFYTNVLLK